MTESTKDNPPRDTKRKSAIRGLTPVVAFGLKAGSQGEDLTTVMTDMLCDIMHLARACDLDPHDCLRTALRRATMHFNAEELEAPERADQLFSNDEDIVTKGESKLQSPA